MNGCELLEKLRAGESLREADLTEAAPLLADFRGVDLTEADLSRAEVTGKAWPSGFAESYRAMSKAVPRGNARSRQNRMEGGTSGVLGCEMRRWWRPI